MSQLAFGPGLRPGHRWGSSRRSPKPPPHTSPHSALTASRFSRLRRDRHSAFQYRGVAPHKKYFLLVPRTALYNNLNVVHTIDRSKQRLAYCRMKLAAVSKWRQITDSTRTCKLPDLMGPVPATMTDRSSKQAHHAPACVQ